MIKNKYNYQGKSIHDFVQRTFSTLIEKDLLDAAEIKQLFDKEFCLKTFAIDFALLQAEWKNRMNKTGHPRYWSGKN